MPLLEIVSEPDMRSGRDAALYGAELRRIMCFLGISDGNMAEGSMRCDVNVRMRVRRAWGVHAGGACAAWGAARWWQQKSKGGAW